MIGGQVTEVLVVDPSIIIEDGITIPQSVVGCLDAFRAWTLSEAFPQEGRIDYLEGNVEVDKSPEDLMHQGAVKVELTTYIHAAVKPMDLGHVFSDSSRYVHPAVGLSCEPDIVFLSWEALEAGRARYVESSPGKLMEIEGAATLVVEIISDSSVKKDLHRLPRLYAAAGVGELWLVDARGDELSFEIRHPYERDWQAAVPDDEGFVTSQVLNRHLRLRREPGRRPGTWRYFAEERPT